MAEGQLNLYIKTVSNAVYPVTVSASIAVSELKRIVSDAANVATDRQRLIYRGRVLQDEAVLSSYNIEDGHTVHLAIRPENIQHSSSVPARTSATAGSTQPQQPRLAVPDFRGQTLMSGDSIGLSTLDEPNTMEHVRQNLLTLHTLLSTSEVPAMQSARQVIGDPSTMNVEEPIAPAVPTGSRERRFYVGQWVDVKDTVNQWLEATVMDINEADRTIFVHYNGWYDWSLKCGSYDTALYLRPLVFPSDCWVQAGALGRVDQLRFPASVSVPVADSAFDAVSVPLPHTQRHSLARTRDGGERRAHAAPGDGALVPGSAARC